MTKLQRREIYWQMYCAAVGLAKLMTSEEVSLDYDLYEQDNNKGVCRGLCGMMMIITGNPSLREFDELKKFKPNVYRLFWFKKGAWKPRAELILKAIQLTYED